MNNLFINHRRVIKWSALALGVIIVSSAVTFISMSLSSKFLHQAADLAAKKSASAAQTVSPAELIKQYSAGDRLSGYVIDTTPGDSIITYKPSNSAYSVQISSADKVQFAKTNNSTAADLQLATNNGKTFLTAHKLVKLSDTSLTNSTVLTYDSQNAVCKLFGNLNPTKKTSTYGLVCADQKTLSAEHDAIQTLLAIYQQAGGSADFKDVTRTTHTAGNKAISLLSINPQSSATPAYTLIFASIDAKWSYIGQRVTPSVDIKDSFVLPAKLKTAVNDPKYDGLLAQYVY